MFHKKYRGYEAARDWLQKEIISSLGATETVDFQTESRLVNDIGLKYHTLNQAECTQLRDVLKTMESKKPGRVRLSVFYNATRFTHWKFTEKMEYLKRLGALDDTDPKQPSLITANYVTARPNCLDASNVYTLCCTNPCEELMGHLEREIGQATAPPELIAPLVSNLASADVAVPRELPPALLGRLDEIAAYHRGEVPLHGRLFAQWMHHAYPRECPFPHEAGSVAPQTAEEWTRESGSSTQASEEERQQVLQGSACVVNEDGQVDCGEEDAELPWSSAEELLIAVQQPEIYQHGISHGVEVLAILMFAASSMMLAATYRRNSLATCQHQVSAITAKSSAGMVATGAAALLVLVGLGWLDGSVFCLALGVCFAVYAAGVLARRTATAPRARSFGHERGGLLRDRLFGDQAPQR